VEGGWEYGLFYLFLIWISFFWLYGVFDGFDTSRFLWFLFPILLPLSIFLSSFSSFSVRSLIVFPFTFHLLRSLLSQPLSSPQPPL
jgi:hypothetical protein